MLSTFWSCLESGAHVDTFWVNDWKDCTRIWVWTNRLEVVDNGGWMAIEGGGGVWFESMFHSCGNGYLAFSCGIP